MQRKSTHSHARRAFFLECCKRRFDGGHAEVCLAADVSLSWMAERKVINAEVGEGEEDERLGRCDIEAVELVPYDVPGLP